MAWCNKQVFDSEVIVRNSLYIRVLFDILCYGVFIVLNSIAVLYITFHSVLFDDLSFNVSVEPFSALLVIPSSSLYCASI